MNLLTLKHTNMKKILFAALNLKYMLIIQEQTI